MHVLVFIIWIVSLVLLAVGFNYPARWWPGLGLFAFDLWIGLHFILETTDPITL
jgi:hypothetical protein